MVMTKYAIMLNYTSFN